MKIFDGYAVAAQREAALKDQVAQLKSQGKNLGIGAILFVEDQGSVLYTRLKREAAERVGVEYRVMEFSLRDDPTKIVAQIQTWNQDPQITGIIIQKPWRHTWLQFSPDHWMEPEAKHAFEVWWQQLVSALQVEKDVDGLHPSTLTAIADGSWQNQGRVLPATCQAVWDILSFSFEQEKSSISLANLRKKVGIIGVSDLLGRPLFALLKNLGVDVHLVTRAEIATRTENQEFLLDFDAVVTATGQPKWLDGAWLKAGAVLIDVGEPQPDLNVETLLPDKLAFLSPVPGGVGPMTVVCLLENCVKLAGSSA